MAKSRKKMLAQKRQQVSAKKSLYIIVGITLALILLVYIMYRNG